VAKQAALAAGQIIKDSFDSDNKRIQQKSTHVDLVTETDKKCEQVIYQMLQQHFPTHAFIGEEQASANGGQPDLTDEPTWMVSLLRSYASRLCISATLRGAVCAARAN
jgi:inositol-phosphate phosphatase/L-galactose 1-phosphate phosphatase